MNYSVIYGHFEKVFCKVGQVLSREDKIGYMGTTGHSTGIHTHISVVEGYKKWCWSLASMNNQNKPSKEECLKLLNKSILNGVEPIIECGWLGYKNHYGYDFIGARDVCWSLDVKGTVTAIGNLPSKENGWGNFVVVTYTYEEPKPQYKFNIGDNVIITGPLYKSSDALTPSGYVTNKETIITRKVNAKHPYNTTGDLGWIDENCIELVNNYVTYIVKKGDTLSSIAKKYNTTWQKIYEDNREVIGDNPNIIKPGQELKIKD